MSEHSATITPSEKSYRVYLGDELLVASDQVLELQEQFGDRVFPIVPYFARDVVDIPLTDSDTESICPIKGKATYLNFRDIKDGVWTYRQPIEGVAEIANYLGFDVAKGFRVERVDS